MNKHILNTLGVVGIIAVVLIGWAAYEFGSLNQEAKPAVAALTPVVKNAGLTLGSLAMVAGSLQDSLAILNRPCGFKDAQKGTLPCGTLADLAKTLNTVRGTFGQIEVAANHENKNLTMLDQQEVRLFSDTHRALEKFIALEVTMNMTVGNIQELEDKLGLVLDTSNKTIKDVDNLVTDQELIEIIQHTNNIADHLDGLSGDIQTKTHELIYPEPCHGKICWVKRSYKIVRGVIQLGEPTYYWGKIVTELAP